MYIVSCGNYSTAVYQPTNGRLVLYQTHESTTHTGGKSPYLPCLKFRCSILWTAVTTRASLAIERVNLTSSPQLDYRPNTSTGTPTDQTEHLHLTHFFSQLSSPQRPYQYARSDRQFGPPPTQSYQQVQPISSMENHEDTLRQLQMLQHSQRAIQSQIDSLTQQTNIAGWYNSQLATELPSGRPNSVVRTVATTPGLPWEPEMTTNQAAYVRTILRAKISYLPQERRRRINCLLYPTHRRI